MFEDAFVRQSMVFTGLFQNIPPSLSSTGTGLLLAGINPAAQQGGGAASVLTPRSVGSYRCFCGLDTSASLRQASSSWANVLGGVSGGMAGSWTKGWAGCTARGWLLLPHWW